MERWRLPRVGRFQKAMSAQAQAAMAICVWVRQSSLRMQRAKSSVRVPLTMLDGRRFPRLGLFRLARYVHIQLGRDFGEEGRFLHNRNGKPQRSDVFVRRFKAVRLSSCADARLANDLAGRYAQRVMNRC